jgi:3-hydroxyacyl-CoA dehydrogenase
LIDTLGPETIIASSTSALLPSKFTDHLRGHRCLVVHPINPISFRPLRSCQP